MTDSEEFPEVSGYGRGRVAIAAAVGFVVAGLSYVWAQSLSTTFETLYRVNPTVEGGGIGADWVAGNTVASLDFLIALVHAADVLMGAFILVMMFVHWAAFRRLADRMQEPGEATSEAVAADGGYDAEQGSDADSSDSGGEET